MQTYTYSIKPVRDNQVNDMPETDGAVIIRCVVFQRSPDNE